MMLSLASLWSDLCVEATTGFVTNVPRHESTFGTRYSPGSPTRKGHVVACHLSVLESLRRARRPCSPFSCACTCACEACLTLLGGSCCIPVGQGPTCTHASRDCSAMRAFRFADGSTPDRKCFPRSRLPFVCNLVIRLKRGKHSSSIECLDRKSAVWPKDDHEKCLIHASLYGPSR